MINKFKSLSETEKIIVQQAKEQGFEQGLELGLKQGLKIQLYNKVIKKLIIRGESDAEICDLLDVDSFLVKKIRKEIMG